MRKVVIIGATGMLGKPVAHEMITAGLEVTIVARDIEKAAREFTGCTILEGDLQDPASLDAAFQGNDAVYLSLHVNQDSGRDGWQAEREGLQNVIDAASRAGIGCIGFLSSLVKDYQGQNGFNWWMFDIKQEAVLKLKNSGIPYLIFYPSSFMENLVNGYKRGGKVSSVGTSHVKKYWIAGSDYGKQVVSALEQFKDSKEYVIQGPEGYTDEEAIQIFIAHYSPERLSSGKVPLEVLKFIGLFSKKMKNTARMLEALNKYPEKFQADRTWADLGRPSISVKDYAKSF
jgi:uncharacterized protein YbjT (DUF2867 family)